MAYTPKHREYDIPKGKEEEPESQTPKGYTPKHREYDEPKKATLPPPEPIITKPVEIPKVDVITKYVKGKDIDVIGAAKAGFTMETLSKYTNKSIPKLQEIARTQLEREKFYKQPPTSKMAIVPDYKPSVLVSGKQVSDFWVGVGSYLKKQFISPDSPDQSKLKAEYDIEQQSPTWLRLLIGDSIVYDKKTKMYYRMLASDPPMISPAGPSGNVTRIVKPAVKTIPINWNKILEKATKIPKVTKSAWDDIANAIARGKVNEARKLALAAEKAKKAKQALTVAEELARKEKIIEAAKKAAWPTVKQRWIEGMAEVVAKQPSKALTASKWLPFKPSQLTKSAIDKLFAQIRSMSTKAAINTLVNSHLVTIAVARNPAGVQKLITNAGTVDKNKILTALPAHVAHALEANQLTQAQQQAQTQVEAVAEAQTIAQRAAETASESSTQGDTATETQTKITTQIRNDINNITDTQVQEQVETMLTSPYPYPFPIPVQTSTPPTPPSRPSIKPPVTPPVRTPTVQTPTIPPIVLPNAGNKQAGKLTATEKQGATAWAQGFGWWIVFVRKGKIYTFFHKGQEPPSGIRKVKGGKGEAYRSVQQYKGIATKFKMPLGIVQVGVEEAGREPGKGGAIRFTPIRPRITAKRPKIR